MILVLDTNVLISAAISPRGNQARVVRLWFQSAFALATSDEIVEEYQRVFAKEKFASLRPLVPAFLAPFAENPRVTPTHRLAVCQHEPDNRFIECAEAAQADFLVTGNLRHFPRRHGRTEILSTVDFLLRLNV